MDELLEVFVAQAWYANLFCLCLLPVVRCSINTKLAWAVTGVFFLSIALTNAMLVVSAGGTPSSIGSTMFGLVVLGSLGARFVGEWLTSKATS